jgi:hypothetical protein
VHVRVNVQTLCGRGFTNNIVLRHNGHRNRLAPKVLLKPLPHAWVARSGTGGFQLSRIQYSSSSHGRNGEHAAASLAYDAGSRKPKPVIWWQKMS